MVGADGGGRYLNASAFMRAPEVPNGTSIADEDFGNSGVGIVRGPGQHNLDLAIERSFPVKESHSFLFRTEFFNPTNTPQFGTPNTGLGYGDPLLPAVASPRVWSDQQRAGRSASADHPVRSEVPVLKAPPRADARYHRNGR